MISRAGRWTQTPFTTPLQPKKWNAHFWIMFNFSWFAGLVDGLKPHPLPLCSQKNEMLLFWITLNFWWLARLSDGLKPHPPSLSSQKNEMLIFVLLWTFDDKPGWLKDSNPICHPSPAKKMKCSFFHYVQPLMISRAALWTQTHLPPLSCQKMKWLFLDYVQLLMISWVARWTWTRSTPHLQPKNWNAHILIMFNFWW